MSVSGPCVMLVTVSVIAFLSSLASAEMFTSIMGMERSLQAEHELAPELRTYINMEKNRLRNTPRDRKQKLETLERVAGDFEKHSETALVDPEKHVSNPLNAYLLIRSIFRRWELVEDIVKTMSAGAEFLKNVAKKSADLPTKEDLLGAALALFRLQDTYSLSTAAMASGVVDGVTGSPVLSAGDCFELGRIAYNQGDHYHTVLWMNESLHRMDTEEERTADRPAILEYLSYSLYMKGNVRLARDLVLQWLKLGTGMDRARQNLDFYEGLIAEGEAGTEKTQEVRNDREMLDESTAAYESLCRGEPSERYKYQHKLTCHYRRHHPVYYLAPALEEVVHLHPHVYLYHHVMTDKEADRVKDIAQPKLRRSGVFGSKHMDYRISKSAWIEDSEDPLILRVSRKTGILANLTRDTVEPLQVLNYGIGGHYEPHLDFARPTEKHTFSPAIGNRVATTMFYKAEMSVFGVSVGNRIATTIFYMSDVEAGGCTVFPEVGIRVCPEKGSMALWYNLLLNGEGDFNTEHAACPVLSGSKWVATKWYHIIGNEFTRRCSLNPDE